MHFPRIWRSKFTDVANSKKTQSLGKNGCRQKCLDKSLKIYIQWIIQKKSASGSWMVPCLIIFFWNFILTWKCQKGSSNRGPLVSPTAIYQTKCPFTVLNAFFCFSRCCPMILNYSLILYIYQGSPNSIKGWGNSPLSCENFFFSGGWDLRRSDFDH